MQGGGRCKPDRDAAKRVELEHDFFAGLDPQRRHDGTRDDDLPGAQLFAERGEHVGDVTHYADQIAGIRLWIGSMRSLGSVSQDTARETVQHATRA